MSTCNGTGGPWTLTILPPAQGRSDIHLKHKDGRVLVGGVHLVRKIAEDPADFTAWLVGKATRNLRWNLSMEEGFQLHICVLSMVSCMQGMINARMEGWGAA